MCGECPLKNIELDINRDLCRLCPFYSNVTNVQTILEIARNFLFRFFPMFISIVIHFKQFT